MLLAQGHPPPNPWITINTPDTTWEQPGLLKAVNEIWCRKKTKRCEQADARGLDRMSSPVDTGRYRGPGNPPYPVPLLAEKTMQSELKLLFDLPPEASSELQLLLDANRFIDAISYVSNLPDHLRSMALEREVVRWRIRACEQVPAPSDDPEWPPTMGESLVTGQGIPETTPDQLSPALLAEGVLQNGALLVRGLIQHKQVEQLKYGIDHALDACRAHQDGSDPGTTTPWYSPCDPGKGRSEDLLLPRHFVEHGSGVLTGDSPRTLGMLISVLEDCGVVQLIEGYFGERPALSMLKSTLRRIPPTQSTTGWHQDGAFLGSDIRSMNLWISLSHCGEDASGLDIVPRRFEHIIETGTDDAPFKWAASDTAVKRAAGRSGIVSPIFAPGDAIFFDHFLMHRTGLPPQMTHDRYAIESWFFAPSRYPTDQIPLWI